MIAFYFKSLIISFFLLLFNIGLTASPNKCEACICGTIKLDSVWDTKVYLSYIPTFSEMYQMSNEMIIARTTIDSTGYFRFDTSFLPKENNLFRIHITKKGDSPTTIVIGGKDENHLFFLANRFSSIQIKTVSIHPPFKHAIFTNSVQNKLFQEITDLVFIADSIASESGLAKRQFIENKTNEELKAIADSAANPLISLYAIYQSDFESNYATDSGFYKAYLKKWRNQENSYFKSFRKQVPIKTKNNNIGIGLILAVIFITIGFILGRFRRSELKKQIGIGSLSVQERKIFQLLKQGASNQDISEQYNIGISTVKSHVSSILAKLNMKSRKEIMNLK